MVLGTLVGERAMFGIALLLALSLVAQVWLACLDHPEGPPASSY